MTALTPDPRQRQKDARARARAGRIRLGIKDYIQTLGWIAQARAENDHITLGYQSWQAYVDGEYGEARIQLPADMRRKAVEELRLAGATTREIGHTIGVSQTQVRRDLAEPFGSPEPARSPVVEAMKTAIDDATERAQDHRADTPGDPELVGLPPATDEVPDTAADFASAAADAEGPAPVGPSAPQDQPAETDLPSAAETDGLVRVPSVAEGVGRSSQGQVPTSSAPSEHLQWVNRIRDEVAAHPRRELIEVLADTMHAVEDDDGNGRHISYYRSLALATVELLPNLYLAEQPEWDYRATCGPEECRSALPGGCCADAEEDPPT